MDWKNLFSDKEQDSTESATKLQSDNFEDQQETISFNNEGFRTLDLPVELSASFKQNKISGGTSNSGDQGWDCLPTNRIIYLIILIEETLSFSGSIFKRFSKYIGKVLSFLDQINRDLSVKVSTSLQLTDSIIKNFTKPIQETLTLYGLVFKSPIKQLTETLTLTEQIKRNFTKLINTTLTFDSRVRKHISLLFNETQSFLDTVSSYLPLYIFYRAIVFSTNQTATLLYSTNNQSLPKE